MAPSSPSTWRERARAVAVTLRGHPMAVSWVVTAAALSVYFVRSPARIFRYDADYYWDLRTSFGALWSFTDFNDALRGYAFPWVLRLVSDLLAPVTEDADSVVRLFHLALVPTLLCVLIPLISKQISPATRITIPRLLTLSALYFLAWGHDLLIPLSDITALFAVAVAVLLVLRYRSIWTTLAGGFALGLACNMRPAYLPAAFIAVLALYLVREDGNRRVAVRTIAALAGLLLASAPQIAINAEHFDSYSLTPSSSSEITRFQLLQGLKMERYDTYAGPRDAYPTDSLVFANEAVQTSFLMKPTFDSVGDYLVFAATHPLDVLGSYSRHVVNGLDTRFGGTYVESITDRNPLVPVINFTVLVIAVASLVSRWVRRTSTRWRSPTTWFVIALMAACAPGVTGAVEVRFLLPLHITLLAAATLGAARSDLPAPGRSRTLAIGAMALGIVVLLSISGKTMSSLQEPMWADGSIVVPGEDAGP